eukprot:1834418-Rhodomonas_salina.2
MQLTWRCSERVRGLRTSIQTIKAGCEEVLQSKELQVLRKLRYLLPNSATPYYLLKSATCLRNSPICLDKCYR